MKVNKTSRQKYGTVKRVNLKQVERTSYASERGNDIANGHPCRSINGLMLALTSLVFSVRDIALKLSHNCGSDFFPHEAGKIALAFVASFNIACHRRLLDFYSFFES